MALGLLGLWACSGKGETTSSSGTGGNAPAPTSAIFPTIGTVSETSTDCTTAYTLPDAFTGADGLQHHGWTLDDLTFGIQWNVPVAFPTNWISNPGNTAPSARVRPWLTPSAGSCYRDGMQALISEQADGEAVLGPLLAFQAAFNDRQAGLDALPVRSYQRPTYPLDEGNALLRALRGLYELPNPVAGSPLPGPWDEALEQALLGATNSYPEDVQVALATLVLAIGEAHLLKAEALANVPADVVARMHQQFLTEGYASFDNAFVNPDGGMIINDIFTHGETVDVIKLQLAAQSVAQAADELRQVLAQVGTFEAAPIELLTPHGRVVLAPSSSDDVRPPEQLADVVLLVDLGGNDSYDGRYASTHAGWMSASVLIDMAGDDRYGSATADIESDTTSVNEAFNSAHGFTQGSGLFGVGVLLDAAGTDSYAATVHAQGSSAFGVGLLADYGGADSYRLGYMGQGTGHFGSGVLLDLQGQDDYRVYTMGQGVGKPAGSGLLLDATGHDSYLGYYNDHGPELPGPAYPNHYNVPGSFAYNDGSEAHYMSICQGVGWGYRHEWTDNTTLWAGGFGALLDFGDGDDVHMADVMAMGQGFVYGFGFLYDDGGDDHYRNFWWGQGASAHMGVGLLFDRAGNDDHHVTRASGGFGFDAGVGWLIDQAGDDSYGGQMHYGDAYTWGMTFFINEGGDDIYNAGGVRSDVHFGIVRKGFEGFNLMGAFLDLGGGNDTYVNAVDGVSNDANWYPEPINPEGNQSLDPEHHKAIGIDR